MPRTEKGRESKKNKNDEQTENETPSSPNKGEKEGSQKQSTLDKHLQTGTSSEKGDIEKVLKSIHSRLESSQEYIKNLSKTMLTEDVLKTSLDKLKEGLQDHIKKEINKVYKKVDALEKSVKTVEDALSELNDTTCGLEIKVDSFERENKQLKEENENLQMLINQQTERMQIAEKNMNELEQYTRRNSIRIYGIGDANKTENESETAQKVIALARDKLQVTVKWEDIDIAHRTGKFTTEGNRPIICKFVSRTKRLEVMRNRKKLKRSGTVIREDLTLKNAKRLEATSANESVEKAWSDNGRIFAVLKNEKIIAIDYKTDLKQPFDL